MPPGAKLFQSWELLLPANTSKYLYFPPLLTLTSSIHSSSSCDICLPVFLSVCLFLLFRVQTSQPPPGPAHLGSCSHPWWQHRDGVRESPLVGPWLVGCCWSAAYSWPWSPCAGVSVGQVPRSGAPGSRVNTSHFGGSCQLSPPRGPCPSAVPSAVSPLPHHRCCRNFGFLLAL